MEINFNIRKTMSFGVRKDLNINTKRSKNIFITIIFVVYKSFIRTGKYFYDIVEVYKILMILKQI